MKNKTKTIIGCTVALLVVAAGVGALGVASKGFSDWNTENWGSNFEDLINDGKEEGEVSTTERLKSLDVDKTDTNKTYKIPSGSLNFGNSRSDDDMNKEEVVDTLTYDENKSVLRNGISARGFNDVKPLAAGTSITYPQTITLNAEVEPIEAEQFSNFTWTISWSAEGVNISDFIVLENANTKNVTVKVLKAFNYTATLKVEAQDKEGKLPPVSANCSVNFYKQLTGINMQLTGSIADKLLSNGDTISYTVDPTYSDGTIDQVDDTPVVISYSSLLSDVTINYDFNKIDSQNGLGTQFDINEFYSSNDNFTGLTILSGKGRNTMNQKLKDTNGDFKITATKGKYAQSINLNIEPETVIYPESVQIGDGSDIEIGKN